METQEKTIKWNDLEWGIKVQDDNVWFLLRDMSSKFMAMASACIDENAVIVVFGQGDTEQAAVDDVEAKTKAYKIAIGG